MTRQQAADLWQQHQEWLRAHGNDAHNAHRRSTTFAELAHRRRRRLTRRGLRELQDGWDTAPVIPRRLHGTRSVLARQHMTFETTRQVRP